MESNVPQNSSQLPNVASRPITTGLTLAFFACLVLVPAMFQHEPLRWQAAQAIVEYENGNRVDAIESLEQLAPQLEGDGYLQTKLFYWFLKNGQSEKAIEHCDRQFELNPKSLDWLTLRMEAECEAGEFAAAWQTFQQRRSLAPQHVSRSPNELNEQAYFRSLAGVDLELAAVEIQQAISSVTETRELPNFQLPLRSQALVAAGLLARESESQLALLDPLGRQIKVARQALANHESLVVGALAEIGPESFPPTTSQESAFDSDREKIEFHRRELAFLLVCRALLFENLGRHERCDLDRAQVAELGFDPQVVADLMPSDSICQALLVRAIAFLDTRALVLTKMPWSSPDEPIDGVSSGRDVLVDLNIAVVASEVFHRALQNLPELSKDELERAKKTFAAVLYHRVMANQKIGDLDSVQSDRDKIRSLGYDPDGNLY